MGLAAWWHRVSMRWLNSYIERLRRDPDVGLDDFRQCQKALSDHDRRMRESIESRAAAPKEQ